MTSYTNARPEAGLFVRLPRPSRLRLRCHGQITRHSENVPLRARQAGSLLCVHHRRIDRSRLPVDSACPCRANRSASFRADHAAFSRGRSTFLDHASRKSGALPRCLRHQRRWRSRVLFRNGSVAAANCHAGAFIDAFGFATLMPEEEPESPGEVRSQSKRCLPSVDE
jgi:hypothetical protein